MICKVCKANPVTIPVATTCSLECACKLNGEDYNAIAARLAKHIEIVKKVRFPKAIPNPNGRPITEKPC